MPQNQLKDTNFDKLSEKFAKNIYGTPKGQIRAAVLQRDLNLFLNKIGDKKLRILDAGGGFGYLSQQLAAQGHQVVLCDISEQMLALAQQQISDSTPALDMQLIHCAIQDLSSKDLGQFDLILCHAVAEWLIDAKSTLGQLNQLLKPDGLLSLMFYNKEAMRFHNLVSGNFDYVAAGLKVKKKIGLTPTHPLYIDDVKEWITEWKMEILCQSGVRVVNDYLKTHQPANFEFAKLLDMELKYSQREPYISLGRYVHFVCQYQSVNKVVV